MFLNSLLLVVFVALQQVRFASLGLPAGGECGGGSAKRAVSTRCHLPRSREIVEVRMIVASRSIIMVLVYPRLLCVCVSPRATACMRSQMEHNSFTSAVVFASFSLFLLLPSLCN